MRSVITPHSARAEPAGPAGASSSSVSTAAPAGGVLALITETLESEKAEEIVAIDLAGKSSIADHMVIASGRSSRHVGAICEKLMDKLKQSTGSRPRAEGIEHGDWALIDAGDVIVHVFRPEVRAFYALEKMWAPATARADASSR